MWLPGQGISNEVRDLIIAALNDDKIKQELSKRFDENLKREETKNELDKRIRTEADTNRTKYRGSKQSYDSLTSGNVNLQARMAASGYDVYGRVIIDSAQPVDNNNIFKKMKNRIRYGRQPHRGFENRGSHDIE